MSTSVQNGLLERLFKLSERNTNVKTEVLAGITSFMTMAYILIVNPIILSKTGMDFGAVFTATALSAMIATLIMALLANLPFVLAPGMGLNAFFTYAVVIGMGHTWQFALTAIFLEGIIFIFLTFFNIREAIINCIPMNLKYAITVGIGLFIAFIGLKNAGIVVDHQATLVTLGDLTQGPALLAVIGLILTGVLLAFNIKGALLIGIIAVTVIGIPLGVTDLSSFDASQIGKVPSMASTFWQFEFENIFTLDMMIVLITFLFVDLFDTVGTLIGVSTKAGLLDEEGKLPAAKPALLADAIGTTIGAVLGTSTVTTYVESAAGVAEGGRTGLTAMTAGLMFGLSLFLAPLFILVPGAATAPVLVIVGLFMLSPIKNIELDDYTESIPAFLAFIMMPFTFSIAEGIVFGIVSYVILKVCTGRFKEIPVVTYFIAALFICKIIFMH